MVFQQKKTTVYDFTIISMVHSTIHTHRGVADTRDADTGAVGIRSKLRGLQILESIASLCVVAAVGVGCVMG